MKGRTHLHIDWIHLIALLFCLAVWAFVVAAGARLGGSYRLHRLLDHMGQAAAPLAHPRDV